MTRRTVQVAIVGSIAGLLMLVLSFLFARGTGDAWSRDWWSGILVEAGAAVLFLVPLYLITRSLDQHIETVREETAASVDQVREDAASSVEEIRAETATSVDALADRVTAFEGDVDRRLDEIARSVSQRLLDERKGDTQLRKVLGQAPTRSAVLDVLTSAFSKGLISHRRTPRVPATQRIRGPYVSFDLLRGYDEDDGEPLLRVEHFDGELLAEVPWPESKSVADVMVDVGRKVELATGDQLDVAAVFVGLSDLLEVASSSPDRRPIVQLSPPLWALTTEGAVTYGSRLPPYSLTFIQLWSERIHLDMKMKKWSDEDSFLIIQNAAEHLFKPAPRGSEEPPF